MEAKSSLMKLDGLPEPKERPSPRPPPLPKPPPPQQLAQHQEGTMGGNEMMDAHVSVYF